MRSKPLCAARAALSTCSRPVSPIGVPRARAFFACVLLGLGVSGCDGCSERPGTTPAADAGTSGLSPERAALVLARVGERTITLGDYAAALERMDPFERMRYQTKDRRQALLEEMINVELLAREAERRGLDRRPETIELVRQFQRDEVLRRLRESLPGPEAIEPADVSRYYQQHRQEFFEPERRRAAHIVLTNAALAERVLAQAKTADADRWRALVAEHAPAAAVEGGDPTSARPPAEVPGDLGMLSLEGADPGATPAVPDAVRRAVFEIEAPGGVAPRVVAEGGRFHIVRLISKVEARQRALEEVETLIRVRLVEARQNEAVDALVERLRKTIEVRVDEAALTRVPPPGAPPAAAPGPAAPAPSAP